MSKPSYDVVLKYVREPAEASDGYRVLVDRLWPRGVTKERAALDEWCKQAAPTAALRQAFHHGGMSFEDFAAVYRIELTTPGEQADAVAHLRQLAASRHVTLLYGTRGGDTRSSAPVLLEVLTEA